ncbi:MAG TPA: alpha/beta hydrolase [Candidatus Polarisedimenticolia bacterium]|jgi:esterase/lipase superfamily enzyme
MILVSCRERFDHNRKFSAEIAIRNYPNLARLGKYDRLHPRDLVEEVRGQHILILVHGFRNPLNKVAPAYARLEQGLGQYGLLGAGMYGKVIGFLWPGFETALGFFVAVPSANRSASHLRKLLNLAKGSAHSIDVQTHSLGARVGLQAMAFPSEVWVDNLLLSAPAVDNESLEPGKEFHVSLQSCRRCLVYHSTKDGVLKVGYRVGALDKALGYKGPQHPEIIRKKCREVFVVDCSAIVKSHGGYRAAAKYYQQWVRVLSEVPLDRFEKL